jgi:hypothetical protein
MNKKEKHAKIKVKTTKTPKHSLRHEYKKWKNNAIDDFPRTK